MAKRHRRSSREERKPKAEKKKKKTNASEPSQKPGVVRGLEHLKT